MAAPTAPERTEEAPSQTGGRPPEEGAAKGPGAGTKALSLIGRYGPIPIIVAVGLFILTQWVNSQELTNIGARFLARENIVARTVEHLELTFWSTFWVLIIAVPLGILLTRRFARRLTPPVLAVANAGQSIPSIGLIVLMGLLGLNVAFFNSLGLGFGFRTAVIGLVAYSALPILRNTMVGIEQVDRSVIESGRGMGMTTRQVLWHIELPLAIPVMLAGVRTALILNVGTAALATFVNGGGLGDIINGGIANSRNVVLITGGVLGAGVALMIDWLGGLVEDVLRPKGL
jgi:osmoprotectant transport system permease protein